MKTNLKMGVWVDHYIAYLFDKSVETIEALHVKTIITKLMKAYAC